MLNWRDRYVEARLTGPDKDITKVSQSLFASLDPSAAAVSLVVVLEG